METEGRAIVTAVTIAVILGFIVGGMFVTSRFQSDTYDCTVKCPDMAHSIYAYDKCYCEVK